MLLDLDFEKKLENFHLSVRYRGEASRIGILGASGCGKSMTLRTIAGIETPDRGRIRLGGRTLLDSEGKINLRPQERRVGYLFQNYALFPTMTVEQNIMAGVRGTRQERQARAKEMVRTFQMEGLEKRRPGELSGGQQQRVALARIMAYRPQAVLLYEPFSAMDYFLKERLRLEMDQVLRSYEGLSVMVTHDRDEAYQLCEYLLLMHAGRIIGEGPTREVFEHPETVEAARLTGCKNISRIRPLGPHRVCALDWGNLELTTEKEVTDDCTHVGIRAHDFYPTGETTPGQTLRKQSAEQENRIPLRDPVITELPFEWYIVTKDGIWWKVPRDLHRHGGLPVQLPETLGVRSDAVMLLREAFSTNQ